MRKLQYLSTILSFCCLAQVASAADVAASAITESAIGSGTTVTNPPGDGVEPIPVRGSAAELICPQINEERIKHGLEPLAYDMPITAVALAFAQDMVARDYFNHITPEGVGLGSRLKSGSVKYGYAGENIAKGYEDCAAVVRGWMKSPGHRANILSPNYKKYGIAMKDLVWVVDFTD